MRGKKGPETCMINGCEKKHASLGLCNSHYKQHRKQVAKENETYGIKDGACSVPLCFGAISGHGLCQKHYMRKYRAGYFQKTGKNNERNRT